MGAAIATVLLTCGAVASSVPEPSHPPVQLSDIRTARLLIRDGQLEQARTLLEQARPINEKEQIERLRLLGQVEMRLGRPDCAAISFETILALKPELARIQLELLRAYRLSRDRPASDDVPKTCEDVSDKK